jgi:hypothetical protein
LKIRNCPKFEYLNLSGLKGLNTLELISDTLKILNLSNCKGKAFDLLHLENLTALTNLNLNGAGNTENENWVIVAPDLTFNDLNF